jgi:hypothetical protein
MKKIVAMFMLTAFVTAGTVSVFATDSAKSATTKTEKSKDCSKDKASCCKKGAAEKK